MGMLHGSLYEFISDSHNDYDACDFLTWSYHDALHEGPCILIPSNVTYNRANVKDSD